MKKVLIICDLFPPSFGPRMGYLCKYIQASGWEPTVLTEQVDDEHSFGFLANTCKVTYVNYYTAQGKWFRRMEWLLLFILDICFGYKDRLLYKEAKRLFRKDRFDVVLCSTYRTFPLPAAYKVSRKLNIPLVVDLRDMIEQYSGTEFIAHTIPSFLGMDKLIAAIFKRKSLVTRNRIAKAASYVTTISPWHVELLKPYNPKVKLIYNGFDPELFYPEKIETQRFIITYTGRILSTAMRNPDLLLQALARLSTEGILSPDDCNVHWYVDPKSWDVIRTEAEKSKVSPFMEHKGYVSAPEIPKIVNSSSILLVLTNRSGNTGPKGIMTTKFFESLAVGKPILCVRSDESYLAKAIRETKAGLAATNVDEVCDFLRFHYREWKEKGYTTSPIEKDKVKIYSRKEQALQFVCIFNEIIMNK